LRFFGRTERKKNTKKKDDWRQKNIAEKKIQVQWREKRKEFQKRTGPREVIGGYV
jgi:hypothetical protein